MIVCLDVDYREAAVVTACVGFETWGSEVAARELVIRSDGAAAAYTPGRFFERELPYLRAVLAAFGTADLVIVDGYVWLAPEQPGLGAHLHAAIGLPVVGVAKTHYAGSAAIAITRGESATPLFVTAVGCDPEAAAEHVRTMHGPFRIPTLIKRADTLARS